MSLETRLVEFIEKNAFKIQKVRQRDWGSYEISFSLNGKDWFHDPEDVFGRAWSTHQALMMVFAKHYKNGFPSPQFNSIMRHHIHALVEVFTFKDPPPKPPEEQKLLPRNDDTA